MGNDSKKVNKGKCNLGCRLTKRLLGQILVDGEFASTQDIEKALEQQRHTSELLGEALVRTGALDPLDLKVALAIQTDLSSLEDAVNAAAGPYQMLGKLLLRAKHITSDQLNLAIEEQERTGEKLGEVLVRLKFLTGREIDAALAFQRRLTSHDFKRFSLGEILVEANYITREQLKDVLARRELTYPEKIGEVLVEEGYVEPHHIEFGLNLQHKLVTAALIASLSLASIESADVAHAAEPTGASKARVTVTATVPARASIKFLYQAPELVVTNADISRGYVEIPGASRIELKSNNPDGYMLVFEGANGPVNLVREIDVQGLGRDVQIDAYGGGIVLPSEGLAPVTKELSYRFVLSDKAQPGTYMWPLTMSVRPMQ